MPRRPRTSGEATRSRRGPRRGSGGPGRPGPRLVRPPCDPARWASGQAAGPPRRCAGRCGTRRTRSREPGPRPDPATAQRGTRSEAARSRPALGRPGTSLSSRAALTDPGASEELLRAVEVGRVHHLALEGEREDAVTRVDLEERDQLARLVDRFFRRREDVVDHRDLRGMNGDLAGEAHRHALLALAPETGEVGDVDEDGAGRLDASGGSDHRAHDARVARDVEVLARLVAYAAEPHRRP